MSIPFIFSPGERKVRRRLQLLRYRNSNRELVNARAVQARRSNPEKAAASQRKYCDKNKNKRALLSRQWRRNHPGYYTDYWREYRRKNRGAVRAHNLKRKSLKRGASTGSPFVNSVIKLWRSCQSFVCEYCGREFSTEQLHIEHMTPLVRGGKHCVDNICPSCPPCNSRKFTKTKEELRRSV
jgi:5-methylcytosine-specific restriction endonuclease McrA